MGDSARQTDFTAKAIECVGDVEDLPPKNFERNDLAKFDIERPIDGSGSSCANQALKLVAASEHGGNNIGTVVKCRP